MSLTAITADDGRPILWVPPVHHDSVSGLLFWVREAIAGGPEARRRITENHPLLFALVYLSHHLRSDTTQWRTSLCQMHIDMAEEAMQWRYSWGPGEYRVAWVGPRDIGKSTWCFLILPCWAMAHNWRETVVMFTAVDDSARRHFRNLRAELAENPLLREDYPEFCTPGVDQPDNALEYISVGGQSFAACSLMSDTLGFKQKNKRPDLMVCDDIEPTGAKYSAGGKQKRLQILLESIFPMNLNACVIMIGTVTRYGAIMHDVVQAATGGIKAEWIAEEGIDCRYYPAVIIDPSTGREESIWPQRWSYDFMQRQRGTRLFQLGMMNMPQSQNKGFWRPEDWRYDWPFDIDIQVLAIDPAMKSQEVNDPTGVAVVGFNPAKSNAIVQFAEGVRLDPDGMRNLIKNILVFNPKIGVVVIETNQGGDYVERQLKPVIPSDILVVTKHEDVPKIERIKELHDWHQQGWVWHAPGLHALETQEAAYPDVDHDDIVDAVAKGVRYYLQHRPLPLPA